MSSGMNGWTKSVSKKVFLQNGIKACIVQLKRDPGNEWWENYRKETQDKLDTLLLEVFQEKEIRNGKSKKPPIF